jgi:two-component system phosphate regulon sensor histidine kinase PhoR
MSKKKLWLIVGLMSIALTGIFGLQLYSVYSSYKLNLELFENNVHAALDHVVSKLEQFEIQQTAERYKLPKLTVETDSGKEISTVVEVEAIHSLLKKDSLRGRFSSVKINPVPEDSFPKKVFANEVTRTWKKGSSEAFMTHFKTYFTHHTIVQNIPIEQRVSLKLIDKLLHRELTQKGITATYAYGVYSIKKDTFVLTNQLQQEHLSRYKLPKSFKYQATLFPSSQEQLAMLFIDFPNKDAFIWQGIILNLILSLLFTGIIIFGFYYTVYVILHQKKLSEMKTDFLNNMTHEFKTPIATISLATDAIRNLIKTQQPEKAERFIHIIKEENERMDSQVGKVLQMARIDKNEFKLNIEEIDVLDIVNRAADRIALQIEKKNGLLNVDYQAKNFVIEADETHFTNVILNLLDNANKYSPEKPEIYLKVVDASGGIKIIVEDKGLGISKEARKYIFDKFYRVPTGDVHDIKGFGLGLSYVKAIVTAHAGHIDVKSEPGKGSSFTIFFPLKHKND